MINDKHSHISSEPDLDEFNELISIDNQTKLKNNKSRESIFTK